MYPPHKIPLADPARMQDFRHLSQAHPLRMFPHCAEIKRNPLPSPQPKKKKRPMVADSKNASESANNPDISIMDLTQDSDQENSLKIVKKGKKTQGIATSDFNNLYAYFDELTHGKDEVSDLVHSYYY
jgi:hypothetical protein